jgi:hypothetical protein
LNEVRKAWQELHIPVPVMDVWAEYHRLNKEEGWEQRRIASAKGCDKDTCSSRIKAHEKCPESARKSVMDGVLDEGHIAPILGLTMDVNSLREWLPEESAQTECVNEVLSKHRDSSAGIKPTVKVVREAAKRGDVDKFRRN